MEKIRKTEEEWRRELTPEQYRILREKGTEPPWSGEHNYTKDPGVYRCAGCGAEIFRSDEKFESGSGWPSFFAPASEDAVATEDDNSFFMRRCAGTRCRPTSTRARSRCPLSSSGPSGTATCSRPSCAEASASRRRYAVSAERSRAASSSLFGSSSRAHELMQ